MIECKITTRFLELKFLEDFKQSILEELVEIEKSIGEKEKQISDAMPNGVNELAIKGNDDEFYLLIRKFGKGIIYRKIKLLEEKNELFD
jgi:hypothetical protein